MNTVAWTFAAIAMVIGGGCLVLIAWAVISQLLTPLDKRYEQVRKELLKRESPTGVVQVSATPRVGVKADKVREIAEELGFVYDGDSNIHSRQLNFHRPLPGGVRSTSGDSPTGAARTTSTATSTTPGGAPDHSAFLAQLASLTTDSSGTARVDLGDFHPRQHKELVRLADAHGWTYVHPDRRDGRAGFLATRHGTETVTTNDEYFIKGPGIDELSRDPVAQRVATEAEAEFGVNPLSPLAYNEAAARYKADSRRTNRWAAVFTLPFLTLIVVALATGRLLGDGGTTAAVVVGIWVGLAALATLGVVGLTHAHRRRKANLAPYKQAYEKVAHAAVHGGHGISDRSAADDAH